MNPPNKLLMSSLSYMVSFLDCDSVDLPKPKELFVINGAKHVAPYDGRGVGLTAVRNGAWSKEGLPPKRAFIEAGCSVE